MESWLNNGSAVPARFIVRGHQGPAAARAAQVAGRGGRNPDTTSKFLRPHHQLEADGLARLVSKLPTK
jgi:hypothetical protein